jgi:hypothetical protein
MRENGRIRFAREITQRVDGLRDAVRSVKGELLGRGTRLELGPMIRRSCVTRWSYTRLRHHQAHAGHSQPSPELQGRPRMGTYIVGGSAALSAMFYSPVVIQHGFYSLPAVCGGGQCL